MSTQVWVDSGCPHRYESGDCDRACGGSDLSTQHGSITDKTLKESPRGISVHTNSTLRAC